MNGIISRPISALVIHHSASPLSTKIEDIRRWHQDRKFETIGYHYVITSDGVLHRGRDVNRVGAHAAGHNSHTIGLCLVGDNTKEGSKWTIAQRSMLVLYVRWFQTFYPKADILGHRDLPGATTLCPGLDVRPLLIQLGALPEEI